MSDRLPAPGAAGGGAPTPGSVPVGIPEPRRTFRRQTSYHKPGLSEFDALQRLQQRRAQQAPRALPAGRTPAPPPPPQSGQAPPSGGGAFSPLTQLIGEPPAQAIVVPPEAAPLPGVHPLAQQPPLGGQDPIFDLTVGGEPARVSLSELIRGYMRERDYTAKTQALSVQARQATEQFEAFKKAREALESRLPSIVAQFGNEFDQPIDWIKLAQTDPIGYATKDARHKAYQAARQEQANLQLLKDNEQRVAKERMRDMGMQFLAQTLPGWADSTTRREIQSAQMQYLRDVGFSQPEIDATELLDPRHVVILEEARRFRQLVAAYPDLLRAPTTQPVPPARFGVPTFGGNGQFARISGTEAAMGEAQQRWDQMQERTGRAARETAIELIAARRRAREGQPLPVMASPRRRF